MSYNPGTGIYTLPAIYLAVPGTTIIAAQHNTPLEDLEVANNYARPIVAGGSGQNSAVLARGSTGLATEGNIGSKGTNIASAAALPLVADFNYFHVTGTVTVTSISTRTAGQHIVLEFEGILTLTHNAVSLILPNGLNILTYVGYIVLLVSEGAGNWRFVSDNRTLSLGAVQATTSGTAITFTVPTGARRIMLTLQNVSTNGTNSIVLGLGDSGGIEVAGYAQTMTMLTTGANTQNNGTGAFAIASRTAGADTHSGIITLALENPATFTWTAHGAFDRGNTQGQSVVSGFKSLSAELTTLELSAAGNTFDGGSVNVMYE